MKVSDVMTRRVISINPEASIVDAICLMMTNHISGLPVIDREGKLVGMVSEGDFLRRAELGTERHRSVWFDAIFGPAQSATEFIHSHGLKVEEVMTRNPAFVLEDSSLAEVVHLMETRRIKRLPVLRGARVVGILSRPIYCGRCSVFTGWPQQVRWTTRRSATASFPTSTSRVGRQVSRSTLLCTMASPTCGAV